MNILYNFGNNLYKKSFWLYRPLYFNYKRFSDRKKINLLKNYIKPGMRVADVGSNIGFYTELMAKAVGPEGLVFSFEPDSTNFAHLQKIAQNNIILENKAVGNTNDVIKLYISDDMNVDHHTYDDGTGREYQAIESIRLDDYFSDKIKIDTVKMDIQGFDFFALQGMKKLIERANRFLLIVEFWPYGMKKAGVKPDHFLQLVKKMGLDFEIPAGETLQPENYNFNYYCDLICTKK